MEDKQRAAFTESEESDWAKSARLLENAVVHEPDDREGIITPAEWHALEWDSERQPPKTIDEARAALNARVTDPDAPDSPEHVGVYDELEDEG